MANLLQVSLLLLISCIFVLVPSSIAQSDCSTIIIELAPCLPYVSDQADSPSAACCSALSDVVKKNISCLCTVINSPQIPDISRALNLPSACNIPVEDPNKICPGVALPPSETPAAKSPVPGGKTAPAPTAGGKGTMGMPPTDMNPSSALSLTPSAIACMATITAVAWAVVVNFASW